jgi:putative transposase
MRYRRAKEAGATYFFTVNLANRHSGLLIDRVDDLRNSVRLVKRRHAFEIAAWVGLPDHLHALWKLPAGDSDFSTRWAFIKAGFSRCIKRTESVRSSRAAKGEREIWQRRFWEHQIRNEDDLSRHIDYVHFNPVKHGYATHAVDWQHSSIHRYIRAGGLADRLGSIAGSIRRQRRRA